MVRVMGKTLCQIQVRLIALSAIHPGSTRQLVRTPIEEVHLKSVMFFLVKERTRKSIPFVCRSRKAGLRRYSGFRPGERAAVKVRIRLERSHQPWCLFWVDIQK